jgi:hypothetical protein
MAADPTAFDSRELRAAQKSANDAHGRASTLRLASEHAALAAHEAAAALAAATMHADEVTKASLRQLADRSHELPMPEPTWCGFCGPSSADAHLHADQLRQLREASGRDIAAATSAVVAAGARVTSAQRAAQAADKEAAAAAALAEDAAARLAKLQMDEDTRSELARIQIFLKEQEDALQVARTACVHAAQIAATAKEVASVALAERERVSRAQEECAAVERTLAEGAAAARTLVAAEEGNFARAQELAAARRRAVEGKGDERVEAERQRVREMLVTEARARGAARAQSAGELARANATAEAAVAARERAILAAKERERQALQQLAIVAEDGGCCGGGADARHERARRDASLKRIRDEAEKAVQDAWRASQLAEGEARRAAVKAASSVASSAVDTTYATRMALLDPAGGTAKAVAALENERTLKEDLQRAEVSLALVRKREAELLKAGSGKEELAASVKKLEAERTAIAKELAAAAVRHRAELEAALAESAHAKEALAATEKKLEGDKVALAGELEAAAAATRQVDLDAAAVAMRKLDLEAAAKRQLDLEAALMGATVAPPMGAAAELGREPSQPLQATLLVDPFVPSEPAAAVAHPVSGGRELPAGEPRAAVAGAPRVELSPPPQSQSPTAKAAEEGDDSAAMSMPAN